MADSSPHKPEALPSLAGVKRTASFSTLLPAFDPCSSSPPGLPRPLKRVARDSPTKENPLLPSFTGQLENKFKYPTPVPTSETHVFSSSPPAAARTRRPALERTVSQLSQRAPLGAVPTAVLDLSGEPMLFGRSGKSSHFQLQSTSKVISRVHLRATYVPPKSSEQRACVEVVCMGWNGMRLHCQGEFWDLEKDDSFTWYTPGTDVMVDVADTRVVIHWPVAGRRADTPESSDEEIQGEESPSKRAARASVNRVRSDIMLHGRLGSPISPLLGATKEPNSPTDRPAVQIYEDNESDQEAPGEDKPFDPTQASTHILTQSFGTREIKQSFETQDFSDADEENDPVVVSFGPMGANLLPKMASFSTTSPARRALSPLKNNSTSPHSAARKRKADEISVDEANREVTPARVDDVSGHPVINHVVNQLAFSRLNQLPLSMIMNSLPTDLKEKEASEDGVKNKLSFEELRSLIGAAQCIGEVRRVGKDAAGMPLESEYYYIPEKDFDNSRKEAVVGQLRKPGLRACRKQHKQYFWRKPK